MDQKELQVCAEVSRTVVCPDCKTRYVLSKSRDRVRCFTCEAMLVVGIEVGDMH